MVGPTRNEVWYTSAQPERPNAERYDSSLLTVLEMMAKMNQRAAAVGGLLQLTHVADMVPKTILQKREWSPRPELLFFGSGGTLRSFGLVGGATLATT